MASRKPNVGENADYTVKKPPKIEKLEKRNTDMHESSWLMSFIKCTVTIFMAVSLLLLLVASKLSFVSISQRITLANSTKKAVSNSHASCDGSTYVEETAFIMLVLLMMIPQLFCFVRSVANSAFRSSEPWPSKKAALWGIFGSILEVFGLCLFTLVIATWETSATNVLTLMNGIYFVTIPYQLWKQVWKMCNKDKSARRTAIDGYISFNGANDNDDGDSITASCLSICLLLASLLCAVGGAVAFVYFETGALKWKIISVVFMVLLSMAWCPSLLRIQIKAKKTFEYDQLDQNDIPDDDIEECDLVDWEKIRVKSARERMTLITSLVKLILTPAIAALYAYSFYRKDFLKGIRNGFSSFSDCHQLQSMFITQVVCSFLAHIFGWVACVMGLQKMCFALPILLSFLLSICLTLTKGCVMLNMCLWKDNTDLLHVLIPAALLWIAQIMSTFIYIWKPQQFLMAKEEILFWLPSYDGILTEQFLIANRKNEVTDDCFVNSRTLVKESCIYICTTMYHEADFEMEQLLHSIAGVDAARKESRRQFESHIFFDDGARGQVIKWYALQLISLLPKTLKVTAKNVGNKLETPYGLQLKWRLPGGMPFVLHLKDNHKVKNKKRWSQVMYMSYVLDFKRHEKEKKDDLTYILTTDADVRFTPDDVSALMDLMMRNHRVAAVCGRTRPMGAGPLVWYQIFDYAVGHWLLKVANHVFGSVLCSPGCFSVYRATALRDVLPLYSTGIDSATDFLTKDMGEDRWLCTLMVEAGWKLEYSAVAENSTYCPDNFDEFFKQRRRWTPSTIANQVLLINNSRRLRKNNDIINFLFILYQIVLMISTVIGPATVILIIVGGLEYSYAQLNFAAILIVMLFVIAVYIVICLKASQQTQLNAAKFLTFVFAVIMAIAVVGIILKSVIDVGQYVTYYQFMQKKNAHHPNVTSLFATVPPTTLRPTQPPIPTKMSTTVIPPHHALYLTPTTWYLFAMIGLFLLTAILHGFEFMSLIHGLWYLLCLPSGYLLLTIYSVANLTDRSWGTREAKVVNTSSSTWQSTVTEYLEHFCWCLIPPARRRQREEIHHVQPVDTGANTVEQSDDEDAGGKDTDGESTEGEESETEQSAYPKPEPQGEIEGRYGITKAPSHHETRPLSPTATRPLSPVYAMPIKSAMKKPGQSRMKKMISYDEADGFKFPGQRPRVEFASNLPRLNASLSVEDWLPRSYKDYVPIFQRNGYDNVSFLYGIKEKDLVRIGITNRGHRKRIMQLIDSLPPEDIEQEVPEDVEEWLTRLGLEEYWPRFKENSYSEPRDLADLKFMDRETLQNTFDIEKEGHLTKIFNAVKKLQYPTQAQKQIRETRKGLEGVPCRNLRDDNGDEGAEYNFWNDLREICLLPEQAAFGQSQDLKEKLCELRDTSLVVLIVGNVLWLTFMLTVMNQGDKLTILGTNFASVAFLFIYALVLFFQVLAMILHRCETWIHLISRTPFRPGKFIRHWSFNDADLPEDPDPEILEEIRRKRRRKSISPGNSRYGSRMLTDASSSQLPAIANHTNQALTA
eukprot:gene16107-17728_t